MISLMAVGLGLILFLLWFGFYLLIRRLRLVRSTAIGVINSLLSGLFFLLFFGFSILMISATMHYLDIRTDQQKNFFVTAMALWLLACIASTLVMGPW